MKRILFKKKSVNLKKRTKKWPNKNQWSQFFRILNKKEKFFFFIFFILFLLSFASILSNIYLKNTKIQPAQGGTHIEGIVGQPRFINPIYANSDVDRDLNQLIFSGLMKYDDNLQVIPDLVEEYEIEENNTVYKFYLKENLFWEDKTPLTSEDIVFTIRTIQDPEYKSPLRANWIGVEVEKIGDQAVKFKLRKSYNGFLENCTVKILPKHIWQDVSPESFPFEVYNLEPIGSGPYKIVKVKSEKVNYGKTERVEYIALKRNSFYHGINPNISDIKFLFFDNEKDLIKAAKKGKVKGFSLSYFKDLGKKWQSKYISLPRYFAVFFNSSQSKIIADKNVRTALNYGTDKKELIKRVMELPDDFPDIKKIVAYSPILPKIYGFDQPTEIYEFDIEKAKEILEEAGFKENENGIREKRIDKKLAFEFTKDLKKGSKGSEVQELQKCLSRFPNIYPNGEVTSYFGDRTKEAVINFQEEHSQDILEPWGFDEGTGLVSKTTRAKLNEICFEVPDEILVLKLSLITVDQPQLVKVIEELQRQWKELGIEVEIKKLPVFQLEQDFIKPRDYEALLFGEVLGAIPDLLPFWHSSQKRDPGLNLSIYENKEVDDLLEKIRQSSDTLFRAEKLALIQDIIIEDMPALFLYSPDYIYFLSRDVKGVESEKIINPSKRFAEIENWYIKTKRVWK